MYFEKIRIWNRISNCETVKTFGDDISQVYSNHAMASAIVLLGNRCETPKAVFAIHSFILAIYS